MSATSATLDQVSQSSTDFDAANAHRNIGGGAAVFEQEAIYYPITQRDPNDIRMILRLSLATLCFAAVSLVLAGLLTYRLTRSAELIVVERTAEGDRVVGDDRHHTLQGSIQMRPDAPSDG